jgi:hypothetical protein
MKCLHNGGLISRLNLEKVEKMIFCVLIDYRKLILMVFFGIFNRFNCYVFGISCSIL